MTLMIFAIVLSCMTPQEETQDDPILKGLAAKDPKVILATLELMEATKDRRVILVPALLPLTKSTARGVRPLALAVLNAMGDSALPALVTAAKDPREDRAIPALRQIAKVGTPSESAGLMSLLDGSSSLVASETCRALYFLASEDLDGKMMQRLGHLDAEISTTPTGADTAQLNRRYDDTLYYVSMRQIPGTYRLLVAALERNSERTQATALGLIKRLHSEKFYPDARKLISEAGPHLRRLLHDHILSFARPADRTLGLELLRKTLKEDSVKVSSIAKMIEATSHWLGNVVPVDTTNTIEYELHIENRITGKKKVLQQVTSKTHHENEVYAGITMELPFGDVLQRPLDYEISSTPTGDMLEISYRSLTKRPAPLRVGLGSSRQGIWYGRTKSAFRTGKTLLDRQERPRQTMLYAEDGSFVARTIYSSWIETGDGKWVPGSIRVETRNATIVARYAWKEPGFWHLQNATYYRRQDGPDGKPMLQHLSTATTKELKVKATR